jgi:VPS62-like protein
MRRGLAFVAAVAILACGPAAPVRADEPAAPRQTSDADADADAAQQLADRFAPILMLKQQSQDCDPDGEPYRPSRVDIVLDNPEIALRQLGNNDPVVKWAPTASDLFGLNQGFYLDFPGSALNPGCTYETDFWKYTGDQPAAIYAHIVQDPDRRDRLYVQYWFYWYFNDWNNKHESDWEGITLQFNASTVEEALQSQPIAVGYSQHEGGERATWNDAKLTREGDHPVVYPSAGSHASYYGEAVYLGRGASEGFGCDTTTGPSDRVVPEVVVLPDSVADKNDPLAWLAFNGRWGERQSGPFNGPTGPAAKERWLDPAPWFEDLRDDSVVIPGGDSEGKSIIDVFCDVVARGSQALINFKMSPAKVVFTVVVLALLVWFVVRRTAWDEVEPRPVRRRRRVGQIIRAALEAYQREPFVFLLFGLVYIPAAILAGVLAELLDVLPAFDRLRATVGTASGTNMVVSLLIGSLVNLAAFVVVNSMVADYMERDDRGIAGAMRSVRLVKLRWRDIAAAFGRAYAIVFLLLVSTIGVPIGVFMLVRYQFIAQTVMTERLDGRRALRRSGRLTRGRWFHTAVVSAGLNGLVLMSAVIVGLFLLILVPSLPLWAFSALSSVVYAILVPLAAISMTLLYGDAVAEHEGLEPAGLVQHDADRPAIAPEPA